MSTSTESFRDQLYNTDTSGRRVGFFPKRPKGRFYNRRKVVSVILLAIFFITPWIKLNGDPLFLINVFERRFILFGNVFMPQDFLLLALLMITLVYFIFVFTTVLGRIWCGWTCPQTIFLEMVYRRIEYWIEGDSAKQRRLAKKDWDWDKTWKRGLKHSIFVVIAFLVSNTVLAYIIGVEQTLTYIVEGPQAHLIPFIVIMLNAGAFYMVFSWFREQACIYVCPYGRLQGVLLNAKSLVISYDHKRGEPRGKLKAQATNPDQGDCINCNQCVAVCPTGIDIRHGTQLECVNCTACIDACDNIMDKINKPRGLIRYASSDQIDAGAPKYKLPAQAYAYAAGLVVALTLFTVFSIRSGDLKTKLLRAPGQTYTMTNDGNVTNLYNVTFINKKNEERELTMRLTGETGKLTVLGNNGLTLEPTGVSEASVLVELPPEALEGLSFDIGIEIVEGEEVVETIETKFNGPML